jgi:hypothetical protein
MSAHPPAATSNGIKLPPYKRPPRRTITVDTEVSLSDFDDDAILEYAKELMQGGDDEMHIDVKDLANEAYLAIVNHDLAAEHRLAREIIGRIIGRIL